MQCVDEGSGIDRDNDSVRAKSSSSATLVCSVCLCALDEKDSACRLACDCELAYHKDCIARWITKRNSCPQCRKTAALDPAAAAGVCLEQARLLLPPQLAPLYNDRLVLVHDAPLLARTSHAASSLARTSHVPAQHSPSAARMSHAASPMTNHSSESVFLALPPSTDLRRSCDAGGNDGDNVIDATVVVSTLSQTAEPVAASDHSSTIQPVFDTQHDAQHAVVAQHDAAPQHDGAAQQYDTDDTVECEHQVATCDLDAAELGMAVCERATPTTSFSSSASTALRRDWIHHLPILYTAVSHKKGGPPFRRGSPCKVWVREAWFRIPSSGKMAHLTLNHDGTASMKSKKLARRAVLQQLRFSTPDTEYVAKCSRGRVWNVQFQRVEAAPPVMVPDMAPINWAAEPLWQRIVLTATKCCCCALCMSPIVFVIMYTATILMHS